MQRICWTLWQVPASASGSRSLAKPGSMPLTNRLELPSRAASSIGVEQLLGQHLPRVLQEDGAAADDVHPGGQDAPVIVERVGQPVVGHRGVDRALRAGGQHRVQVGGRGDPGRDIKAGKLSGVFAGFGIRRHPHAGELVVRVGDQCSQRVDADVAGADRGDSNSHGHRSGIGRSRLGKVMPPSTSITLPVR